MKLIIGLGNTGEAYKNTRHNVGYLFVDEFSKKKNTSFVVKKTDTFMNDSGSFVKKLVDKYKVDLDDLYVVYDDLDILLGSYKIQKGKSPKDHNGIKSVDEKLGTKDYWHVRIGIDNRPNDNKPMGEEYVLQNFTDEERKTIDLVIREVCKKLETV